MVAVRWFSQVQVSVSTREELELNVTEIQRLAGAIAALRPEWPAGSLRTFITTDLAARPLRDAAVALAWVACEPETRTPARVLAAGPWWTATGPVTDGPRGVGLIGFGELCHHCGSIRAHCQSPLVQRMDPHPYRTAYEAALERARAERRGSGQPPLKAWTPTGILGPGGPSGPRRREIDTGLAEGRARFAARQAELDHRNGLDTGPTYRPVIGAEA